MKLRQKLLLDKIDQMGSVDLSELAECFFVSEKTIRNDIQEINDYMKKQNNQLCFEISDGMVAFIGDEGSKMTIRQHDAVDNYYLYKLSGEERVFMIIAQLICSDSYITIDQLANQLYVSRGTINSDLLRIKQWCKNNNINIQFIKSKGIRMEESEKKKREILTGLISDHMHIGGFDDRHWEAMNLYHKMFKGIDISAIKDSVLIAEEKFNYILSDDGYEELVVQIAFSIIRDKTHPLHLKRAKNAIPSSRLEYDMAQFIVDQINQRLHAELARDTVDYLSEHINGEALHSLIEYEETKLPYIQIIAEQMIVSVGKTLNFDFHCDKTLYNRLVKHLCSAIRSVKNGITMDNPLKKTLIQENTALFEAIKRSSGPLRQFIGMDISDDEFSYLLIYFASTMESTGQALKKRNPTVAVLCNTGHGTAQLVVEELKQYFSFDIKYVLAAHQLARVQKKQIFDFAITTIPLKTDLPFVLVSPIIRRPDIEKINQMMINLGFISSDQAPESSGGDSKLCLKSSLADSIRLLLKKYDSGEELQLADQVQNTLDQYKKDQKNVHLKEKKQPMLSDVLKIDYIELDVLAEDWKEAVRAGGEILFRNGVVAKSYIEAAIQNVMDLGPYIVLTKGVAIPHAGKKFGVYSTAISFVRLKTPVCFGNKENDPVKYIFTLATIDSSSHLVALKDLVSLFDHPEFFQVLDQAETSEDIIAYIKNFEMEKERE
ncbi:PTS sugar transporter subunit IIA [Clostridium sp. KNHs216]|uniref:BglG family transcription antiterminator n=1 Tax=Clostridium sp. KNHs216 TaxID=1550235 RepID=UPI0011731A99|nr:PTS sugar transporter subunit IIA [Clostridium sp. KNHs216]TQI68299.1 transcriptional antiterminator [Clostridium sp. KNHs216]